jgi:hypothetical protein
MFEFTENTLGLILIIALLTSKRLLKLLLSCSGYIGLNEHYYNVNAYAEKTIYKQILAMTLIWYTVGVHGYFRVAQ